MRIVGSKEIEENLSYKALIPALREAFSKKLEVPRRHHHHYRNPGHQDSTLLLMPAWEEERDVGVKLVTISPDNGHIQLPSIHGLYIYLDAKTGQPLALMDAQSLTKIRTAATSALASSYLARTDFDTLLMVGTGALAPELIKAHCFVHNISSVLIWGRDYGKASQLAASMDVPGAIVQPVEDLQAGVENAQIVSSATLSRDPLVLGEWVKTAKHIDLVGSYKPDMREADDALITKASIFVDTMEGACHESGDLAIPLKNGIIEKQDIIGDLQQLCNRDVVGRTANDEITVFKSVGHAIEDLVAARLVYKEINI